jgi:hypothetical protein
MCACRFARLLRPLATEQDPVFFSAKRLFYISNMLIASEKSSREKAGCASTSLPSPEGSGNRVQGSDLIPNDLCTSSFLFLVFSKS